MTKKRTTERLVDLGISIGIAKAEIHVRQQQLRELEDARAALLQEVYPATWVTATKEPPARFCI